VAFGGRMILEDWRLEAQAAPRSRRQGDELLRRAKAFLPVSGSHCNLIGLTAYSSVVRASMRHEILRRP
jgi:hypothetical protein